MIEIVKLIASSMKAGDRTRTEVLRAIKTKFTEYKVSKANAELTEAIEIQIISKMVKSREDSISKYKEAGRDDLAASELAEIEILKEFLPKPVAKEEIEKAAKEIVDPSEKAKMGIYIKTIKNQYPAADGKLIADVVKDIFEHANL